MFRPTFFRRAAVLAAVATAGAAADVAAQPGRQPLSPRDTVRMEIPGGHRILVDYGRPFMRGRVIMGELVPFGRVWRTGANAATTFSTDVDLKIGDAVVPRGTYTLYTIPTAREWMLIINRQTGQWGTQYDASRDLVRIPMQKTTLTDPVEQFTISLEPGRNGSGTLTLAWETTRVSVPFQVVGAPTSRRAPAQQPRRRGS